MKRNKHICINLTEDEYNSLLFIANKHKRKLADTCYLIVSEQLQTLIVKETQLDDYPLTRMKTSIFD